MTEEHVCQGNVNLLTLISDICNTIVMRCDLPKDLLIRLWEGMSYCFQL